MQDQNEYAGDMEVREGENEIYDSLRRFVTGASPNSMRALSSIKQICETHIRAKYSLEVVDVYQKPAIAEGEQIAASPLLTKKTPAPGRRLIGAMSHKARVLRRLGIIPSIA